MTDCCSRNRLHLSLICFPLDTEFWTTESLAGCSTPTATVPFGFSRRGAKDSSFEDTGKVPWLNPVFVISQRVVQVSEFRRRGRHLGRAGLVWFELQLVLFLWVLASAGLHKLAFKFRRAGLFSELSSYRRLITSHAHDLTLPCALDRATAHRQ